MRDCSQATTLCLQRTHTFQGGRLFATATLQLAHSQHTLTPRRFTCSKCRFTVSPAPSRPLSVPAPCVCCRPQPCMATHTALTIWTHGSPPSAAASHITQTNTRQATGRTPEESSGPCPGRVASSPKADQHNPSQGTHVPHICTYMGPHRKALTLRIRTSCHRDDPTPQRRTAPHIPLRRSGMCGRHTSRVDLGSRG